MYTPDRSQYDHHTQSASVPKANLDRGDQYGMARRSMAPPVNYPPQPVEIEPGSYPRTPGSYLSWDLPAYPTSSIAVSEPSIAISAGSQRIGPTVLDAAVRNPSQDPLTSWWTSNDAPWVARGSVPDATAEDTFQTRGCIVGHRSTPYGLQVGLSNRPINPSDTGSAHIRVPPSDSGYGTVLGPESASVRGSDIYDNSPDNQSIAGRIHENQPYHGGAGSGEVSPWPLIHQNVLPFRCDICQKPAKNRSELKKHKLRHTKPFHCKITSCTWTDGFSTRNDLERHVRSKHPDDIPEGDRSKIYHCLVDGCKSSGKSWPRLDNFKSHLIRVHGLHDEKRLEYYLHKALVDPHKSKGQPLLGISVQDMEELDQDDPAIEDPDEPPCLPWEDDPDWTQSSLAIDRQEAMSPLIEVSHMRNSSPSGGECLVEIGGAHEQADSLQDRAAAAAPTQGCLEDENKLPSGDTSCNAIILDSKTDQGSPKGSLQSNETGDIGKATKEPAAVQIDPCLRDAIIAVLSRADMAIDHGSGSKSLSRNGKPPTAAPVEPCVAAGEPPLRNPVCTPAGNPESLKCSLDISEPPECNKSDVTHQNINIFLEAIKTAGYVLKKDNASKAESSSTADHPKSGSPKKRDQVSCTLCTKASKFRGRPSELKKHMKRHFKPYGCTYPRCNKTFGSKNDWKRHENSLHYQHASWRCHEKNEDGLFCGKVFYTADNARAHFTKTHKFDENDAVQKLEQLRCNPNNQSRFWCGFCDKEINLTETGLDAWNERFNHIDGHFMGRNGQPKQKITDWKQNYEGMRASPTSSSSNDEEGSGDSSTDSSTSSSMKSSSSRDPLSPEPREKRQLENHSSDEQGARPAKQAKHGKHELRVFCCHCLVDCNPQVEAACHMCEHVLCDGCERKRVPVRGDDGARRK